MSHTFRTNARLQATKAAWLRPRPSARERLVEDQAVALVVVHHGTGLVRVVVGALHDAAAVLFDRPGGAVDVIGLDAHDDLAGYGVIDRSGQGKSHGAAVESREVGAVAELQREAEDLGVELDRLF